MRRLSVPAVMVAFGIAAGVLLALAGCGNHRSSSPAESTGEMPDQEVTDFAITETDGGDIQWKLFARYAATYSARNVVEARSIRVDFYGDDGERSSTLTSRDGEINQRSRDMVARGNVVLETTEGTRLSSEELRFLNREQRIVVPVRYLVRVERSGDVLTGYGFESDPELRHYEFKRRVQATVRPRPEAPGGSEDGS